MRPGGNARTRFIKLEAGLRATVDRIPEEYLRRPPELA